jgi:hypothetical protein
MGPRLCIRERDAILEPEAAASMDTPKKTTELHSVVKLSDIEDMQLTRNIQDMISMAHVIARFKFLKTSPSADIR